MRACTILRFTLELTSPMAIGAGPSEDLSDAPILTDANGLPTIPGTSLAGVLRSAWRQLHGEEGEAALFGETPEQHDDEGRDSALCVSWGVLHDADDRPVPARVLESSAFLRSATAPIQRQHVRIGIRGAAEDRGLFDRDMVPAGHRFRFELRLDRREGRSIPQDAPEQLLGLLKSDALALGAATRSGLGRFELLDVRRRDFDLSDKADFRDFCQLPVSLREPEKLLQPVELKPLKVPTLPHRCVLELFLKPRKSWQIGGGMPTDEDVRDGRVADIIPWREARVSWKSEAASPGSYDPQRTEAAVPGSSIKGALRHRTAFYYNAITGTFADALASDQELKDHGAHRNRALWALFGGLDPEHSEERPQAGKLVVSDVQLHQKGSHGFQDHVTLDRFAGGAYPGNLFHESFYWGGSWVVRIAIHDPEDETPAELREALGRALDDLQQGRLQVGAGDARGHGRLSCKGSRWNDQGAWLRGPKEDT